MNAAPNKIVSENAQVGTPPEEWGGVGSGDPTIMGFATTMSVNLGETVYFKVNTDATNYHIDIYRAGYYNGDGARRMETVTPSAALPQVQPAPVNDTSTGLIDCGNWVVSTSWTVPESATSGVYLAKLVREDTSGSSYILFVVRDDDGHSGLLFQTSDTTWQAYNTFMGNSLYTGAPVGRAYKVSYNRPLASGYENFFSAEYPMIRWLEANGYDVSYFTGVDSDLRGAKIQEHKVFLSVGHDEYWSASQRSNVEAARAAGVHLAFFSGNEVFWKTRWENSIDGSDTAYRTLVCYKETHADGKIDPAPEWTGTWRDPRFSPPADGGRPENALTGTIYTVNGSINEALTVPAAYGQMRLWRNTDITGLGPGEIASFPLGTLGYECDEDLDNGFRPAGLVQFSSTALGVSMHLGDFGSTYGSGRATHHLTLYRHSSGALVFGAGTIQWSWGLDPYPYSSGTFLRPDARMQQATVNLFADMGMQPATLQAGLIAATNSTDLVAPTSGITSPPDGSTVQIWRSVTITGTATDADGVVGNVEVSIDGGITWHPASGNTNWSYTWRPSALGAATIMSRAIDDSANLENPSSRVTVTAEPAARPLSLWDNTTIPRIESLDDAQARELGGIELGVKFRSDTNSSIIGIRFYKGESNSGPHVGHLWSDDGTMLAEADFTNETTTGWQEAAFATPVPIAADTTYIASYYAPVGYYAIDSWYFLSELAYPPLRGVVSSPSNGNGVHRYGGGFPSSTYKASNYWVDVVMQPLP